MPTNEDIILAAYTVAGVRPSAPLKSQFTTLDGNGRKVVDQEGFAAAKAAFDEALSNHDQTVKAISREIKTAFSEKSVILKTLVALDKAIDKSSTDGKVFTGTITSVVKEPNTKRGLVTFYSRTNTEIPGLPLGFETARTDPAYTADGRFMGREATSLIGHKVTAFLEIEAFSAGQGTRKMRVIRHLQDLGVDPEYDAATGTFASVAAA